MQECALCCACDSAFCVLLAHAIAGHGILGDKSALYAGKALARHIYSGFIRNKHLMRMEQSDVFNEIVVRG